MDPSYSRILASRENIPIRDVVSFYARVYEKDGPAKVRYWREHHDVVFSQAALWRLLSSLISDAEERFTLGIISVLLDI